MPKLDNKFKILLCGKKELLMGRVRKMIEQDEIHFQYTSQLSFLISRAMFNPPNIVLVDANTDKPSLLGTIYEFVLQFPKIPVYTIATTFQSQDVVEAMREGAKGCYQLPGDYRKLREQVNKALEEWQAAIRQRKFTQQQQKIYNFNEIMGTSPRIMEVLKRAEKVIQNEALTVLITGETGTGKELFARAIHYNSSNKDLPFVDISCSALPDTLLESELFGYERGAFTDAKDKKIGLFELAGAGTIFLDEIGDISKATQSKLLKVLENRVMRRLGGLRDIFVKARIIAATSANLEAKVQSGEFRKDLYHRLTILPLELPPLRERKYDIPLLANYFIKSFDVLYKKRIKGISPLALNELMNYHWEGNVRELRHCIERAILLSEKTWLDVEDIELPGKKQTRSLSLEQEPTSFDNSIIHFSLPVEHAALTNIQQRVVQCVLDYAGGNKRKAANILGISRPRLDRLLFNEDDDIQT